MPLSAFVQRQSTVRVPKEETQQTTTDKNFNQIPPS
jgi:hypothetical protein